MNDTDQRFVTRLMNGQTAGLGASLLRGVLSAIEPLYSGITRIRNAAYSRGFFPSHRLAVPVISVGNITTGGTGKTPVVIWLARQLRQRGYRPAVLLRGYKSQRGQSDEQRLLELRLAGDGAVPVRAAPDRFAAGKALLEEHPEVNLIILDDGFQHRRVARDVQIVLIDATEPFGYGHVLPRGMLREPLCGLGRADLLIVTRSDQVGAEKHDVINRTLQRYASGAPIYRSTHVAQSLIGQSGEIEPIQRLRDQPIFAFCGIGNPGSFRQLLVEQGADVAGCVALADHYHYRREDLLALTRQATSTGAQGLVTTEKDWVKIAPLGYTAALPIRHVRIDISMPEGDAAGLLEAIERRLPRRSGMEDPH
jgi:tetraacyldisaccharide 4'-kinase